MPGIRESDFYAAIWNAAQKDEKKAALEVIVHGFMDEFSLLVNLKRPRNVSEMLTIIDQQQKKWNAMCRKTKGLKPELFDTLMKSYDKVMYDTWKEIKELRQKNVSKN